MWREIDPSLHASLVSRAMFGFRKKPVDDGKSLAQPLPEGLHLVDLGLLGSGGVARVYRVRDEVLHREVALKVLRLELMTEKIAIENFVNEARITAELDHPNIPAVYAMASDKEALERLHHEGARRSDAAATAR